MPAQSGDPITSALHQSLATVKKCKSGEDLGSRLAASANRIIYSEIKFEKLTCSNTSILNKLKSKYIILSTEIIISAKSDQVVKNSVSVQVPKKIMTVKKESISLPTPKKILYSPDAVRLGWCGSVPVGSGFVNLGNSCYLNSILQALFHVPAFVNWLITDTTHSSRCESMNGMTHSECLICAMAKTLQSSQKCTGSVVKPLQIYSKLKSICKHLVHGHQEDAHEFLRYLIEGMERSYLTIFNGIKLDSYSKETTPLNQIFGGYLRSEGMEFYNSDKYGARDCIFPFKLIVEEKFGWECILDRPPLFLCWKISQAAHLEALPSLLSYIMITSWGPFWPQLLFQAIFNVACLECQHVSTTFQHFQDLLLDIRNASSVDDALDSFFSRERLGDGEYAYRCEQCKKKVAATKKFSIERPPKALCIALKRFGVTGGKNSKPINVKQYLDINKFRHKPNGETLRYKLVSLVTHLGASSSCGHYTAVGQTSHGSYYLFDDSLVRPMAINNVLNTNAYILLYEMDMETPKPPSQKKETSIEKQPFLKKEISNGFCNSSNGFSSLQQKFNSPNNIGSKTNGSCSSSTGAAVKPMQQNGLSLHLPSRPTGKIVLFGKSRVDAHQASPSQQQEQGPMPNKINFPKFIIQKKDPMASSNGDKTGFGRDKTLPAKKIEQLSSMPSIEKSPVKEDNFMEIPLPDSPDRKGEEKMFSSSEDEQKSSPSRSLVPYLSESSDSDTDFIPPKPSISKESIKSVGKNVEKTSSVQHKPKGVRIEIEGWDSIANTSQIGPRPELHSPAGSTSSGKWSVTSTEREKSPDRPEKVSEKTESTSNGTTTHNKNERDRSRNNGSALDQLLKTSHRGYGSHVNSWNGGRSEMDVQVEEERNYLKRKRDPYNDDFDSGKAKKVKKFNNHKECGGNHRNKFQEYQNWKNNGWKSQRQKFYHRDYSNRSKPRYYFNRNSPRVWE